MVFTIAALVHLFGITFYGVFASGELQPWAETAAPEQEVWSPSKAGAYPTAETAFVRTLLQNFLVFFNAFEIAMNNFNFEIFYFTIPTE